MTTRATDLELWAALAAIEPGIVRTISLLLDEIDGAELDDDLLRGLGTELSQIGGTLTERANRVVINPRDSCGRTDQATADQGRSRLSGGRQ